MVRDPEPEQGDEDLTIEGAGEGEWHECHRIGERASPGDELGLFIHLNRSNLLTVCLTGNLETNYI